MRTIVWALALGAAIRAESAGDETARRVTMFVEVGSALRVVACLRFDCLGAMRTHALRETRRQSAVSVSRGE
jgi:hypothetical protein